MPQPSSAVRLEPGALVHVRGEDWRVVRVDAYERCTVLTLDGGPARRPLRIIEPFDRPRRQRRTLRRRGRRIVLRTALAAVANARPALGLWTAAEAGIELMPYQLEPALAVLRGATRVLLADAVGLGKTIEAGLILAELRARGWAERALILCPAGLRATWAGELQRRFNIPCAVFDQATVAEAAAALPPGVNPWSGHAAIVTSIDLAKRDDVRAALAEIPFDVLIADEAHHLTPGTDRGAAAGRIAARATWCVLVSATPHSGDDAAFEYLAGIGGHGEALTIFRRTAHDTGQGTDRRERIVRVRSGLEESAALAAAAVYARDIWHGRGSRDHGLRLVATTILRRAASSPLALRRTLAKRQSLLDAGAVEEPEQAVLPWDDPDEADGDVPAALLSRRGFDDAAAERACLDRLLSLLDRARAAKLEWLNRFLPRAAEPALVFTEYRDTLEAVLAALPRSLRAVTISGAHAPELRRLAVDAFNSGGADVLIATDTAGEGLSLHHRCRLVVNLELPWNPVRLEQRVGRVDRLGQTRRVHALHLVHANSIEQRVLDRIRERRTASEAEVARWLFQDDAEAPHPVWSPRTAAVDAAGAEAARLWRQRSNGASPVAGRRRCIDRRMRGDGAFVAVNRLAFITALGNVIAEYPVAHVVDAGAADRLDAAVCAWARRQAAEIERELEPLRLAAARRIGRISKAFKAGGARGLQPSLFDGRAEDAGRRLEAAGVRFEAALDRRLRSVVSPVAAEGAATSLVAAWPPHRR